MIISKYYKTGVQSGCGEYATDHLRKIELSIHHNIKAFWSHVNSMKTSSAVPAKMIFNQEESENCEFVSKYFALVYKDVNMPIPRFQSQPNLLQLIVHVLKI